MNIGDIRGCWKLCSETRTLAGKRAFNVECVHCLTRRVIAPKVLATAGPTHRGCHVKPTAPPSRDPECLIPSTDPQWARWSVELAENPHVDWSPVRMAEVLAWRSNRAAERRRALEPARTNSDARLVVP